MEDLPHPMTFHGVRIGEVASVSSGFAFKSSDWTDSGIPVVKIANVKNGSLAMDSCSFVSPQKAAEAAEFKLDNGDVLIAMTGYIGDIAVVRDRDIPAVLNQRVGRFTISDPCRLDKRFFFYSLRSREIREEISGLGYGSAQANVSPSLIHSVEIPLPPLSEQRAIAHVLGTLDDKIELNQRMNATLEAMARAVFKDWFVDFGPVRAKLEGREPYLPPEVWSLFPDRLVDSELGEIPEGWEVGALGQVAVHRRSGAKVGQIDPDTPYIALEHMPKRCIALSEWGAADGLASNKFRFERGDILFGKVTIS